MIVPICQVGVVVVTFSRRQFLWYRRRYLGDDKNFNSGGSGTTGPRWRRVRSIRVPGRAF